MFRIVRDPSSGSVKLYFTEIRSGSLMFVVCLVGVWQRNFEPAVCVHGTTGWELHDPKQVGVIFNCLLKFIQRRF